MREEKRDEKVKQIEAHIAKAEKVKELLLNFMDITGTKEIKTKLFSVARTTNISR